MTVEDMTKAGNSLAARYPELAKQWHPTKNGDLTPEDISYGSRKTVWWFLPYDDPQTGKHFDFEWQATVNSRSKGVSCPFLAKFSAVWKGYNDLETIRPDLATQWHPTRNGSLLPCDVTAGSDRSVWWMFSYDDPKTGKHFDFEWKARIVKRTHQESICPFLSERSRVWKGYNDLLTLRPDIASQWHPSKNKGLTPENVTAYSNKKVWWYLPYDDPETGRHFDFEWKAMIKNRTRRGDGCPYLSKFAAVWRGYNDLETVCPDLAAQWHPTRNGGLMPYDVTAGSNKKVWWMFPYDDPKTGKHFDFEWEASIDNRTHLGKGCPFLSNEAVWKGYNDLSTLRPDLAAEWHPAKNGNLTPDEVTCGSEKKVWWLISFNNPVTGKKFVYEWESPVFYRTGKGSERRLKKIKKYWSHNDYTDAEHETLWNDFLKYRQNIETSRQVKPGFNDLETLYPDLAAQWHPTKNGTLTPQNVMETSSKKVWWYLPYDDPITGKHFDFEWQATISHRTRDRYGCPFLSDTGNVWKGFNDLATRRPDLAAQWHPTKNGDLKPETVYYKSKRLVWWFFPYDDPKTGKHFNFEWRATVMVRNKSGICPFVKGNAVWTGYNDLASLYPDIASEWHPRNRVGADKVFASTSRKFWWICKKGHEWYTSVFKRTRYGYSCPECRLKANRKRSEKEGE